LKVIEIIFCFVGSPKDYTEMMDKTIKRVQKMWSGLRRTVSNKRYTVELFVSKVSLERDLFHLQFVSSKGSTQKGFPKNNWCALSDLWLKELHLFEPCFWVAGCHGSSTL